MNKRRRGFTLIELLVAITVLAIVAVLGWRGLDSIVRSRVSLNQELEHTRGLQLAFAQMQSDCDQIAKTESIGNRTALAAQPGRLTMVRMVFGENQPSRVQVVAYRISNGVLTRRESVATRDLKEIDVAWAAAMSESATVPAVTLHSGVNEMNLRTWGETSGWRAAAAGIASPVLPNGTVEPTTGLEVVLRLRDGADLVKVFLLGAA
jgi:general secretion pathway protein J